MSDLENFITVGAVSDIKCALEELEDAIETGDRVQLLAALQPMMIAAVEIACVGVRGTHENNRARTQWIARMRCAIDGDHDYLDSSYTLADTVNALADDELAEDEVAP